MENSEKYTINKTYFTSQDAFYSRNKALTKINMLWLLYDRFGNVSLYRKHHMPFRRLFFNPIQDGLFRGCSRMGGLFASPPPLKLPHISYNDETWHSYTLPKKDPKNV